MRLSKTIITFILSSILFTATFSKANAEKLLAAIADWTGGEISCQVAVSILEDELGYEIDRIVFASGTGPVPEANTILSISYPNSSSSMLTACLLYTSPSPRD